MTQAEMTAALAIRACRAEPIVPDGWPVPNGYLLFGPRGNKGCVSADDYGNPDEFAVRLWLDGIAYGDARDARRRAAA